MYEPISVLIIEDEEIWAKRLEQSVTSSGFTIAAVVSSAADAVQQTAKQSFDIALVDINLHGDNIGIELGKIIHTIHKKPFIFITGSTEKEMAHEAMVAKPSAYLVKPVNDISLYTAIQTAIDNFNNQKTAFLENSVQPAESFFIKTGSRYKKIEWLNVITLSTEGRYTKVSLDNDNKEYLLGSTLIKTISTAVPQSIKHLFVQINRSEVINIKHIEELNKETILTKNKSFQASGNHLKELKEKLKIIP